MTTYKSNEPESFKGFIRFLTDFKMRMRTFLYFVILILIVQIVLNLLYFYLLQSAYPGAKVLYLKTVVAFILYKIPILNSVTFFTIGDQNQYEVNALQLLILYKKLFLYYSNYIIIFFKKSFYVWLLLPVLYIFFWRKSKSTLRERYIRGTVLISEKDFSKKIKKNPANIALNEKISIPFPCENRHFFTIGRPGAGKTQLFCQVIDKIVKRNEKAIIYDFKGDYIARFYDPKTDLIFNPFDKRSVGWCIFNEIKTLHNIESICSSLIPANSRVEPFWENAARDVFYSVLLYCMKNGLTQNSDLHQFTIQKKEFFLEKFSQTPGCERGIKPLTEEKMSASVLSTVSQYVKFLEYTKNMKGDFSIKQWVADEEQRGRIFITNYTEVAQGMQPLLSLFIDVFANKTLMLPENLQRRIFFFLDEFGTLQRLNNILNLLKLSRSYGGSIWIGVQDVGQIESVYGTESAETIINSCANSILFGVDGPKTAESLSKKIGERECLNFDENFSYGTNNYRDGRSMSERSKLERAVLASDFMRLKDLNYYLKLAEFVEFTQSKLNYKHYPLLNSSLIETDNNWITTTLPIKENSKENEKDESPKD